MTAPVVLQGVRLTLFWPALAVLVLQVFSSKYSVVQAAQKPLSEDSISSTLLQVHRMYTRHPPHDSTLYETLRVSPNATSIEILKSYRKLSRHYHPDKQQQHQQRQQQRQHQQQFQKILEAYEILSHDSTRLLYHRYGLHNVATAVLILTGYQNSPQIPPPEQLELLQQMGYHEFATTSSCPTTYSTTSSISREGGQYHDHDPTLPPRISQQSSSPPTTKSTSSLSYQDIHNQRVAMLAATTLERIRPLVEGTLTEAMIVDAVASECDRLKKLPLGAQILRCVGRAYRHSGQGYLQQLQQQQQRQQHQDHPLDNNKRKKKKWSLRDTWHDAKHVLTAVVASGQVIWKEKGLLKTMQKHKQKQGRKKQDKTAIEYHNSHWDETTTDMVDWLMNDNDNDKNESPMTTMLGDDASSDDDDDDQEEEALVLMTDEELQQLEILKAQKVMVELAQIEALWKVHKIGLDRAVREACTSILTGKHFFFPSHQQYYPNDEDHPAAVAEPWQQHTTNPNDSDGWVSQDPTGRQQPCVIDAYAAQWRAAWALVLIGNVMVQSSKEGTAWME
jgi:curved DNA-binding protein CbpA